MSLIARRTSMNIRLMKEKLITWSIYSTDQNG